MNHNVLLVKESKFCATLMQENACLIAKYGDYVGYFTPYGTEIVSDSSNPEMCGSIACHEKFFKK